MLFGLPRSGKEKTRREPQSGKGILLGTTTILRRGTHASIKMDQYCMNVTRDSDLISESGANNQLIVRRTRGTIRFDSAPLSLR